MVRFITSLNPFEKRGGGGGGARKRNDCEALAEADFLGGRDDFLETAGKQKRIFHKFDVYDCCTCWHTPRSYESSNVYNNHSQ